MNVRHLVIAGAVALSAVGCGVSIKTATDYNHNINFSKYQSFYVKSGNSSGNPLMDQRAIADVTSALKAKGWTDVPQGEAETAVVVHAATKTKHTYETLYDGWGGWGWRRWGGARPGPSGRRRGRAPRGPGERRRSRPATRIAGRA